jgi:hypothetical protein
MMTASRKVLIERTRCNLEFIKQHATGDGPFEVTQLINSFLLAVMLNWDGLDKQWHRIGRGAVRWPIISQTYQQPQQAIPKIRDALAHGNIAFEELNGQIGKVHLWTCPRDKTTVDWAAEITIDQLRSMLDCFVSVAKDALSKNNDLMPEPKRCGEDCPRIAH